MPPLETRRNLLVFFVALSLPFMVNAAELPKREQHLIQTYTAYEWRLLAWADSQLACTVQVDHEGLPDLEEISSACAPEVTQRWLDFPVCDAATIGGDLAKCPGLYLHFIRSLPAEREIVVELPLAAATISLTGCEDNAGKGNCANIPFLKIEGFEPLADQQIMRVHFEREHREVACEATFCSLRLHETGPQGERITFWADSSYGDSSPTFDALIRVRSAPDGNWQIDVLSSQWTGPPPAALALEWEAFPPVGDSSQWLSRSQDASAIASTQPYQYLAGQLIRVGLTDASACADGGMLLSGGVHPERSEWASQCGLEQSKDALIAWQNRFDQQIFAAAESLRLSPQLLKNLIAQESQFWPGFYAPSPYEFGLARLTQTGAETTLMWDLDFYVEFCPQVFSDETCRAGYHHLTGSEQAMLRGALAGRVNGDCSGCGYGVDLTKTDFMIEVAAQSLLANAAQVGQTITNLTGEKPGTVSSYEDLWRFVLVNYNAGAGCLAAAIKATQAAGSTLDWPNVSAHLIGGCRDAIGYVENVTRDVPLAP
jgi:hypothetical protein